MLLSVKILGESSSSTSSTSDSFEVFPQDSVESFKEKLREKFGLDKLAELKLLFQGKTLQDGTSLDSYKLASGSKLHLMVKRDQTNPEEKKNVDKSGQDSKLGAIQRPQKRASSSSSSSSTSASKSSSNLDEVLFSALRKHFRSDEDARKVVVAFKRDFHGKLASLNLDDIERVTGHYNQANVIQF